MSDYINNITTTSNKYHQIYQSAGSQIQYDWRLPKLEYTSAIIDANFGMIILYPHFRLSSGAVVSFRRPRSPQVPSHWTVCWFTSLHLKSTKISGHFLDRPGSQATEPPHGAFSSTFAGSHLDSMIYHGPIMTK